MRGKYAVRGRNKRDADERYRAALTEADQLRAKLSEIRSLRAENQLLHERIGILERERDTAISPRVEELERRLMEAQGKLEGAQKAWRELWDEGLDAIFGLMNGMVEPKHGSPAWWRLVGPALAAITKPETSYERVPENIRAFIVASKVSRGG